MILKCALKPSYKNYMCTIIINTHYFYLYIYIYIYIKTLGHLWDIFKNMPLL